MIPLRDENPTHRFPFLTVVLILTNIAVFMLEVAQGPHIEAFVYNFGFVPAAFRSSEAAALPWYTIGTSMFLHGGIAHLLGNMWFLWIFGDNLEDNLGKLRFLLFYFLSGFAATATHFALYANSEVPAVGASGAISGILGGYLVLHPRIRIRTLLPLGALSQITYIPAFVFLGIWFFMQFTGILGGESRVAFGAHIGGFMAGIVLIFLLTRPGGRKSYERYEARRFSRGKF